MRGLYGHFGHHLTLSDYGRGLFGYQRSLRVTVGDMPLARLDFGGESQRGWMRVDMGGKACSFVNDWDALDKIEALPSAEVKRLDIALTTWKGEVTHERVVEAHTSGRFTTRGRPPNLQQITSSDPRAGRTCYVGKRESDKLLRCYEKGFELIGRYPASAQITHIDGFKVEDIYRVELELKSEGTAIPWETVERRDQYFAGSYPFCADVLPGIEPDILQRRPEKGPQRELSIILEQLRHQYGKTLFTALTCYHGDIGMVMSKISGTEHNPTLLEAGVLLVDHQ
jgi:DNA relaxase NicK